VSIIQLPNRPINQSNLLQNPFSPSGDPQRGPPAQPAPPFDWSRHRSWCAHLFNPGSPNVSFLKPVRLNRKILRRLRHSADRNHDSQAERHSPSLDCDAEGVIYGIVLPGSSRVYVGSTINRAHHRFQQHWWKRRTATEQKSKKLAEALNKLPHPVSLRSKLHRPASFSSLSDRTVRPSVPSPTVP